MEPVLIIILLNLLLYFKTLRHKFVSDDFTVFMNPPPFKNWWHKQWLRFSGAGKWMSTSVVFKNGIEYRKTEELEHLYALILHTLICVSIYFAFGHNFVAFVTALLYSANPVNNQATIWPGGRGYALPILSLMLAFSVPLLAPALLFFCSWYTIGFFAPLALLGSEKWMLLGWMIPIWFIHSRKFTKAIKLKASLESFDEDKKYDFNKVIIYIKTLGFYFILGLVPFRITFYHNFLQSMSGNIIMKKRAHKIDRYFLTGLLVFIALIILSFQWNSLSWSLLAYVVTITPFCNIVRANQEIAERFCALPNVFLMHALSLVLVKL